MLNVSLGRREDRHALALVLATSLTLCSACSGPSFDLDPPSSYQSSDVGPYGEALLILVAAAVVATVVIGTCEAIETGLCIDHQPPKDAVG